LPASEPRRRPADLVYAADERPTNGALALLGVQHAGTALAFITYVLATAQLAGLSVAATQSMVATALLGMALCTALQAWGGRLGAGALMVHMPNPFMITFVAALVAARGPGAITAATLVYGLVALAVGPVVMRLRALFPPAVAGTVVCMGGLALVESATRHALGVDAQMQITPSSALVSGVALACIVALSVWGGRHLRLVGLLAGIGAGIGVAAITGQLVDLHTLRTVPVFALPQLQLPVFDMDPGIFVAIALVSVLSQLDTLASAVILDKMDNAEWRRTNMPAVGGGITANGLGDALGSLLGSFPTAVCSANIALAHATRSTSRYIGLAAAAVLLLVAFLPQVTLALTLIPAPVLGAVELYAAAFLVVSGMELIASRAMDSRAIFMVGLSLCAGIAVMLLPGMAQAAPEGLRFLLGSGFIVSGVVVIALNLLFRMGTSRRARQALDAPDGATSLQLRITEFVEAQGAAWGARRDVVQRAALAALEGAEAIVTQGNRQVTAISGSFDEFNLDIEIEHSGDALALPGPGSARVPLPAMALLDADAAEFDAAMLGLSGVLLRHLADRVSVRTAEGRAAATLRLHFDH
jgi:xanthine/uracil permease